MINNTHQHHPFHIYCIHTESQAFPKIDRIYNQFIYIRSGPGKYRKGDIYTEFGNGDLFFIRSNEKYSFEWSEDSEVYLICFTQEARLTLKEIVEHSDGRAVALAKAQSPVQPKIHFEGADEQIVLSIFQLLVQLYQSPSINENICYYQVLCLVAIIERNVYFSQQQNRAPVVRKNISLILNHIHKNLRSPELLTLKYIAAKFNMSTNTLMRYFRKEMKESVKQYIYILRMELIGKLVRQSDRSFSEISYEFGFVDESHFYKSFKRFYGKGPGDFRETPA
ncbi:AraC family transcriptional regulator [Chryseobacterium sp. CT-SW4]|uniref:AraC family transcriptional regulator n=1 Tax=Chryseobacterium sp. SW-1 TaxID=3157343 RepID=UPI003B024EAA